MNSNSGELPSIDADGGRSSHARGNSSHGTPSPSNNSSSRSSDGPRSHSSSRPNDVSNLTRSAHGSSTNSSSQVNSSTASNGGRRYVTYRFKVPPHSFTHRFASLTKAVLFCIASCIRTLCMVIN